jgi:hypothetical protein
MGSLEWLQPESPALRRPFRHDGTADTLRWTCDSYPYLSVGTWSMPWNAKPGAGRLAKGIPNSNFWAHDAGGVDQVGCI